MSNLFTKVIVEPGARLKLRSLDPNYRRFHLHEAPLPQIQPRVMSIDQLQVPDFHEEFIVKPGSKVKLGEIDPSYLGSYESC